MSRVVEMAIATFAVAILTAAGGCQSVSDASAGAGQGHSSTANASVQTSGFTQIADRRGSDEHCGASTGVMHQFRGEDDVDSWSGMLNFPTPERPHHRTTIASPEFLVPYGDASMKFEIRPGDPQWEIDNGQGPKRRAEFSWKKWRFEGSTEGWAGAAFYLPSDPMADNKGTAIFQLHNYPEEGVMWNLYTWDGSLRSTNEPLGDVMIVDIAPYLDRWTRMVVHFKPSTREDGFIRMWLNDELVLDVTGRTKPSGSKGPYFKHGTYFWGYEKFDSRKHTVAYFDNLRIGDETSNYDSVDPACW